MSFNVYPIKLECLLPSSSNQENYSEQCKNLITVDEKGENIVPEFVNIKTERQYNEYPDQKQDLSKFGKSMKQELLDVEVTIKKEPSEPPDDEYEDYIVPDVIPPKTSSHFISDVSDEVLSVNSTIDGKYMCPICYKRFANKGNVQRHMLLHTKQKLECSVCYRKFVNKIHYEKHLLTHSSEKRLKCEECGKMFRTTSNLEQHKKTHLLVKPFHCQTCMRQFAVKANLVKHQCNGRCKKEKTEPIVCNVCNKVFQKEFLLKSHLRRHTTERPYSCDRCQMTFKYKSTLIRHVQLHNGIKPYSCKICRKKFTHAGLIKPHMRKHTGEKPYTCPICDKNFAHKHNMQRHAQRHEKVKNLICSVCNKKFPKESRLVYHMRTHTKAKPFACEICTKKFSHKQNIIRHYSRKHPNDKYVSTETDASVAKDVWDKVIKSEIELTLDFNQMTAVKTEVTDVSDEILGT